MGPKRKRRGGSSCANPLFAKWVEELRDDAKKRDLGCHFTYTKALNSIKKYPLPLKSGEEAKILDHVGNKLAKILDKRLAEYNPDSDSGTDSEGNSGGQPYRQTSPMVQPSSSSQPPPSKRKKTSKGDKTTPLKKKSTSNKEYVPAYKSGPYALIIALYNAKEKPSWRGFLRRDELIAEAQPLCDSSFTIPPDASSRYTAWSSMSTIVRKGLVQRISHPPKFSLTVVGETLARRLLQQSSDLATPSRAMPTTAASASTTCSQPVPPQPSATPKGKGSVCGRNIKKTVGKPTAPSHSPPDHTPLSISSSPEYISIASPVHEISYVESPPVSIPSDFSETESSSGRSSRNSGGSSSSSSRGRGRMRGSLDASISPLPPPLSSGLRGSAGFAASISPSPPLSSSLQGSAGFTASISPSPPLSSGLWGSAGVTASISPSSPPSSELWRSAGTLVEGDSPTFHFWYVDHDGKSVLEKDCAAVTFNDVITVGFLIKCKRADLESSTLMYTLDDCRQVEGAYVYAYLGNLDAPERAKPPDQQSEPPSSEDRKRSKAFPVLSTMASPRGCSTSTLDSSSSDCGGDTQNASTTTPCLITLSDSDEDLPPLSTRLQKTESSRDDQRKVPPGTTVSKGERSGASSSGGFVAKTPDGGSGNDSVRNKERLALTPSQAAGRAALNRWSTSGPPPAPPKSTASLPRPPKSAISPPGPPNSTTPLLRFPKSGGEGSVQAKGVKEKNLGPQKLASFHGEGSEVRGRGKESKVDLSEPEFVFSPGSFEVVLLVDSSESTASRKSSSQFRGILLQELGKNGVLYDVRKLNVGDFTWIAREKATPTPGCLALPRSREIVLDYIVERKRMDDLAGSIIDGRFHEQKFRLKSCGVAHPVYLVEEYGDSAHCKIDLKALNQAVANTQVVDKFFVKRTKDIRESVAYLTIFTRSLQLAYSGKTIKAYSWETIADLSKEKAHCCHGDMMSSSVVHGIEFSKFNEASIKNKPLTVQEMFGRHLMQLPGLSADKAALILEKYPTLKHLMKEAYSSSSSEAEKIKVIQDLRYGRTKRRMGPSLGKLLCSMYCQAN